MPHFAKAKWGIVPSGHPQQSPAGDGLRDPSVIGAKNGNTVDFGLQGYAGNGFMPQRGHYEHFGQSIHGADLIGMFSNVNVGKRGNEVIR